MPKWILVLVMGGRLERVLDHNRADLRPLAAQLALTERPTPREAPLLRVLSVAAELAARR